DAGISRLNVIEPDEGDAPVLALAGAAGDWAVVAFRGTVFASRDNDPDRWKLMLVGMAANIGGAVIEDAELVEAAGAAIGGRAHLGFTALLDEVWERVNAEARALLPGRQLYLTGHSLGGALATLAAYRFQKAGVPVAGVFTFGSPRVFDEELARQYA